MQHGQSLRKLAFAWLLPATLLGATFLAACYPEPGPRVRDNLDPSSGGAPPDSSASGGTNSDGAIGSDATGSGGLGPATGDSGTGGTASGGNGGSDMGGNGGSEAPQASCDEILGEPLPARLAITSDDAPTVDPVQVVSVTKASLWKEFERQTCGHPGCHGGADEPLVHPGRFRMTLNSFDQRPTLGDESIAAVTSSDPDVVMPPGSGDGSQRPDTDPVLRLAQRLKLWQEAGFPDAFDIVIDSGEPNEELPEHPYRLSPELGERLTNIGNCAPRAAFSMQSPLLDTEEMAEKDALFAAAEDSDALPDTLVETDLVSLESSTLARRTVYSYSPTYTLFSDHAGKMRHVRVPVGKTIRYNEDTKDFDIPDNTRFYKTFLKRVTDADGNVGYRKMETRLIVVRRDEALENGGFRPRALRASYAWDKDETMAVRVKDPLRNGKPFADRLCPYVVDERVTRDPQTNPISDDMSEYCNYMSGEELEDPSSGQVRHYAIPSAERCDQCHMGSNNRSYILGFNPWQVDRRPEGEGGIFENPTSDELTQLARLIDYGVITGIEPGEAKLEESQGDRKPRNDYELKAQGYMMGNCVFCHNPNGFPVVQNPILAEFNLYPDAEDGGIFQFSLERYSPRAKAGDSQAVRFPYITPAFGDHDLRMTAEAVKEFTWTYPENPPVVDFDDDPPDFEERRSDSGDLNNYFSFLGPWRSLIWRNVYTPFTYNEDFTIFVHMPRNAPGYDCRAHNIMADWMLSIPNRTKQGLSDWRKLPPADQHQPVEEVFPGGDGYTNAVRQTEKRIEDYHLGVTGQHCPTDDDIIDPKVVLSSVEFATGKKKRPSPVDEGTFNSERVAENLPTPLYDVVPDHAHWVPTDTTDPPGKWVPRRFDWKDVLATGEVAPDNEKLGRVIEHLQSVHLSPELETFALEPLPMGPWALECQESEPARESPTVEELLQEPGEPLRRWMQGVYQGQSGVQPDLRVHFQSRGEAVFQAICQNCHGRQADSRSPLAATILELTGGQTRVANFIDGLFGPQLAPGAFARDEFLINEGASAEDWQARYLLFMGLGGTQSVLPRAVLDLIATSPFYGAAATAPSGRDANMLDSAQQRCLQVLVHLRSLKAPPERVPDQPPAVPSIKVELSETPEFARGAGHYELWESLCTFNNEPVVRAFMPQATNTPQASEDMLYRARDDAGHWVYPEDHPVGNQFGQIEFGIGPDNTLPWCIQPNADEVVMTKLLQDLVKWQIPEDQYPICPESLLAEALGQRINKLAFAGGQIAEEVPLGNQDFTERWVRHGAMNTGIAAYYYLKHFTQGLVQPAHPFNTCE